MAYIEPYNRKKTIKYAGKSYVVEIQGDGIQKAMFVTLDGKAIGQIASDKWTPRVWADREGGPRKTLDVYKYGDSKTQVFNKLIKWLIEE